MSTFTCPEAGLISLDAHWMPFTSNREFKKNPRMIVSAEGNYYTDADGRKIFDALSGLWTCGAGHCRPEIIEAVSKQIKQLDYSPAFQFGHPKAFQLAERITQFMPEGINRVLFTGSGSESVETSLKIARAYWRKKGLASKTKLIGRAKGYHGVNFGGISVGGIGPNRALFGTAVDADHLAHHDPERFDAQHGAHSGQSEEEPRRLPGGPSREGQAHPHRLQPHRVQSIGRRTQRDRPQALSRRGHEVRP